MTMNTLAAMNTKQAEEAIQSVHSVAELLALSQAEDAGPHRRGVLNAIQNRIGQVVVEQQSAVPPAPVHDAAEMTYSDIPPVMNTLAGLDDLEETVEDLFDNAQNKALRDAGESIATGGQVTHRSAPMVTLYLPTDHGYEPRSVPSTNVLMLLRSGWLDRCPDCGRPTCRLNGDQNDCPAMQPRKFAWCPVGRHKRIYDPSPAVRKDGRPAAVVAKPVDENEVEVGEYSDLPPEARIRARLEQHLLAYHPEEASALGLRAQSPRERLAGAARLGAVEV